MITYTPSLFGEIEDCLWVFTSQKSLKNVVLLFVDDFIWDKGEVQSQRHKNGNRPYPLYQYPANCYEHILIFHKHRLDKTKYPCPCLWKFESKWKYPIRYWYSILGM